mmetsp:Transcript_5623/g.16703  ORF Transcript_5623/g.16703 Transcript_5623/m.16703 type:complete len:222 (-) Transcript_5623:2-667(-)
MPELVTTETRRNVGLLILLWTRMPDLRSGLAKMMMMVMVMMMTFDRSAAGCDCPIQRSVLIVDSTKVKTAMAAHAFWAGTTKGAVLVLSLVVDGMPRRRFVVERRFRWIGHHQGLQECRWETQSSNSDAMHHASEAVGRESVQGSIVERHHHRRHLAESMDASLPFLPTSSWRPNAKRTMDPIRMRKPRTAPCSRKPRRSARMIQSETSGGCSRSSSSSSS